MRTIEEREKNLFNATDTLAQFYEEVESFFGILSNKMERAGFTVSQERLRPGTFTLNDLSRRLIGTITVIYIKGAGQIAGEEEPEGDEANEDGDQAKEKLGKAEVSITDDLRIPFAYLSLFTPGMLPSIRNLSSPMLYVGAIGEPKFVEKKTGKIAVPENPALVISNLANLRLLSERSPGDKVRIPCWRPSRMRKYSLEAKLLGFEGQRLLEFDSQEKIAAIADRLVAFCER